MASKVPIRSFQSLARPVPQRCVFQNSTPAAAAAASLSSASRFSTSALRTQEQHDAEMAEWPRWSYTPKQMMAPFPHRIKDPKKAYEVNEDPVQVDQMYISLLGRKGDEMLTDEIKWLAITHKSFDQGRRGFNDRLAFFGRRILQLQTSLTLLHSPMSTNTQSNHPDPYGRTPFEHPALGGLQNLTDVKTGVLTKERLSNLAMSYGLQDVTRWKPKNPANLKGSGIEVVLTTSLYAIIGAISLQKGGDVAARVARERILKPLGILYRS